MGASTEKEQFRWGYGHKIIMEVDGYFKQEIQSSNLLWPKR